MHLATQNQGFGFSKDGEFVTLHNYTSGAKFFAPAQIWSILRDYFHTNKQRIVTYLGNDCYDWTYSTRDVQLNHLRRGATIQTFEIPFKKLGAVLKCVI